MRNHLLGGDESHDADRQLLNELDVIVPHLDEAARDESEFLKRALRWAICRRHVSQVLVLGADLPPREPMHSAVWHGSALHRNYGRVVYLEDDPLILMRARGRLIDSDSVTLVPGDPTQPHASQQAKELLDADEPLAVVIPGLLHRLDDEAAATMLGEIRISACTGSYLIASHAFNPETRKGTTAAEKLETLLADHPYAGPVHFRTRQQIENLMLGDPRPLSVGLARDWFPEGPLTPPTPVLASRLVASVFVPL
jgi:hypothetical protein